MLAIYDLSVSPPTYDFIAFLLSAEAERRQYGFSHIDILVVRGPDNGFRRDNLPPREPERREAMLRNIVLPMAGLLPTCKSIEVVERDRVRGFMARADGVFPYGYTPEAPKASYGLAHQVAAHKAGVFPLGVRINRRELSVVTITLREADYWPSRNSNFQEWLKFAEWAKGNGKRVIFIRDLSRVGEDIPGFECDHEASVDLIKRAERYASAGLNLGTCNGPMAMVAAMPQANVIQFTSFRDDAPVISEDFYARCGFPKGSQFGRPGHKIVWAEDTCENIIQAVNDGFKGMNYAPVFVNIGNTAPRSFLGNMRENCKRDLPWFEPCLPHNGTLVICGGAPSLKDNLDRIKARERRGQKVVALNNAWRVLLKANIVPDYIACMDARPENAGFFTESDTRPTYLIASSVHPSVLDSLEGRKVILWHADQCQPEEKEIVGSYGRRSPLVGGGNTIGSRMMVLGYLMGFRKLHLYGMDSSYSGDSHHAYEQALNANEEILEVNALGKTYRCSGWMLKQANEFKGFYRALIDRGCSIEAHGCGLIPDICREMNRQVMERKGAA